MKNYYKYLKIKRAISYSENECLRFTQAADLNDPFECLPKKQINNSFLNSILRRLKSRSNTVSDKLIENTMKSVVANIKNETPNNIFDIFYRNQYEDLNNEIGILSLSENWNNTLMWSHYTDSHKGICIGFDSNHDFFKDLLIEEAKYKFTKAVSYSNTRVSLPMKIKEEHLIFKNYIT